MTQAGTHAFGLQQPAVVDRTELTHGAVDRRHERASIVGQRARPVSEFARKKSLNVDSRDASCAARPQIDAIRGAERTDERTRGSVDRANRPTTRDNACCGSSR